MDSSYVAGLFDGEGYVRINRWEKPGSSHIRYNLVAGINMTHRPIIEKLHECFGGGFSMNRHDLRKPTQHILYCWSLGSQGAAKFLRIIQPHVVVKRDQIDLALEFQAHIDNNPYRPAGRPGFARGPQFRVDRDELLAFREECFHRIRDMKKEVFPPLSGIRKKGRPKLLLRDGPKVSEQSPTR